MRRAVLGRVVARCFFATVVQAAQASLATVVTDLADVLPQMSACKSKSTSLVGGALHHATRQLSVAGGSASDLVAQARSTIVAAREVWLKHALTLVFAVLAMAGAGQVTCRY